MNFKANPKNVQDPYDNDYIAISDVSPDNTVYALTSNIPQLDSNYYYFDGQTARVVSQGYYPAECATLESQKVGEGMRCADENYNTRTVNY